MFHCKQFWKKSCYKSFIAVKHKQHCYKKEQNTNEKLYIKTALYTHSLTHSRLTANLHTTMG